MRRNSDLMVKQRFVRWYALSVLLLGGALLAGGPVEAKEASKEPERVDIRKMAQETLSRICSGRGFG